MAQGDRAAVDVDLCIIEIECLQITQHHRGERLIDLDEIDVVETHAGFFQHLLGHIDGPGQHQRRLGTDIGKRFDLGPRFEARPLAGARVADQHRSGAIDDAR
jgi:hypothetical protein